MAPADDVHVWRPRLLSTWPMATSTEDGSPGQVAAALLAKGTQVSRSPGTGGATESDGSVGWAAGGAVVMAPAWATTAGPSTVARHATTRRPGRRTRWALSRLVNPPAS